MTGSAVVSRCISPAGAVFALLLAALIMTGTLSATVPAHAVEPDEILSDAGLEARARHISKEIRCLVCRNESIDDSSADLARDLRLLVRERLVAGDTDDQVRGYLVDRFGEFVLLRPQFSFANAMLWLAGPVLFVIGLIASLIYLRGRRPGMAEAAPDGLSDTEKDELDRILKG